MVEEYESIVSNIVWEVVPRLAGKLVVGLRWIFKVKHASYKSIEKCKAIFVAKGYSQVEGIDYKDTFDPIARLKRSLYRLKKAPHAWHTRINSYLTSLDFITTEADANLYHILVEGKFFIIVLYVDQLILTSDDLLIRSCKEDLARDFEMKDTDLMHYFLRLEVRQGDGELLVSQGEYANEILQRFHMDKLKPIETHLATNWRKEDATSGEEVDAIVYRQLMGSLMYLMNTRPDM
eukprot:PITA_04067